MLYYIIYIPGPNMINNTWGQGGGTKASRTLLMLYRRLLSCKSKLMNSWRWWWVGMNLMMIWWLWWWWWWRGWRRWRRRQQWWWQCFRGKCRNLYLPQNHLMMVMQMLTMKCWKWSFETLRWWQPLVKGGQVQGASKKGNGACLLLAKARATSASTS